MPTRLKCRLLGCVCENLPCCHRCGTDIYDAGYVQIGRLDPLFVAWWAVRKLAQKVTGKKCQVCGRRYWHRGDDWTCSDKCFEDWLPF